MEIGQIRKEVFKELLPWEEGYADTDDILVTRKQLEEFSSRLAEEIIFEVFSRLEDLRLR